MVTNILNCPFEMTWSFNRKATIHKFRDVKQAKNRLIVSVYIRWEKGKSELTSLECAVKAGNVSLEYNQLLTYFILVKQYFDQTKTNF